MVYNKQQIIEVLIIEPSNRSHYQQLMELAKKLNSKDTSIDQEMAEDLVLLNLMKNAKTGDKVSRENAVNNLRFK